MPPAQPAGQTWGQPAGGVGVGASGPRIPFPSPVAPPPMFLLHPLLLWSLAAVAVPVAIHLLLRQRPRPRPWAAMRWLLAAKTAASRQWKLTNLLLLLLRCLVLALIALAVARPALGLLGGGRLVLVVDRSAGLGPRHDGPGPLPAALGALAGRLEGWASVAVVAVDLDSEVLADGTPAAARTALERLSASVRPGGLAQAARGPALERLQAVLGDGPEVLLISDFQQDDGTALAAALGPKVRAVTRWSIAQPQANPAIAGAPRPIDLLNDQGGVLSVPVTGRIGGAQVAVDDGPLLATPKPAAERIIAPLPALPAGSHRATVRISDGGLLGDDVLEWPIVVRGPVSALLVENTVNADYLAAALGADAAATSLRRVNAPGLAAEGLPEGGLVALRALPSAADAARLAAWVRHGGALWADAALLRQEPALADLIAEVTAKPPVAGGAFTSGEADVDASLSLGGRERTAGASLPDRAQIWLAAGSAPLVAALAVDRGCVVVELCPLGSDIAWQARGATPAWTIRAVRQASAWANAVPIWISGALAPEDAELNRAGDRLRTRAGQPLFAGPGLWQRSTGPVVVLADPAESRLDRPSPAGVTSDLASALPERSGSDLGLALLLAAVVVLLIEGAVAAWAGRRYGG